MASADLREELNCSICLSIYTDPVNLRCGHNYCRGCIDQVLNEQRASGVYSCPECRAVYRRRPELQKNITLRNIAERFLSDNPDRRETGVFCTYCIHASVPAVKSCLMCEACLCENHLKVHSKSEEHVLVEPSISLANKKCPIHKKILEYYCAQDQVCICALCKDGKHRGHQVEMTYNAANKKKEKLRGIIGKLTHKKEETGKNVQSLQKERKKAKDKAAGVIQTVTDAFKKIRDKLQVLEVQVIDDINKQVEKNTNPISSIIQKLESQMDEVSGKLSHVAELCNVTDPLIVLQEQETNRGDFYIDKKYAHETCRIPDLDEILISLKIHKDLTDIVVSARRSLYVPENSDIDLDEDTAASNVDISRDLKIAFGIKEKEDFVETDDSFESHQVLSSTNFDSGTHYWEVDIHGSKNWRVGMSYDSIDRVGIDSVFGNWIESWCLCKTYNGFHFRHDGGTFSQLSSNVFKYSKRLGIYLDYENGRLSFYHLDNKITHLHTFHTCFTEPLHAAIRVGFDVWMRIM